MVGVAVGAHLHDEGVLRTGLLARSNHLIEGLRGVSGELVITNQCNRLDCVGHAVGLAVVGHALNCCLGELGLSFTQVNGGNDAVLHHLAELVVGHNNHVRAIAGRNLADELLVHVGFRLLHNLDVHLGGCSEVLGQLLDLRVTGVIGPDRQGTDGRTGTCGCRLAARRARASIGARCKRCCNCQNAEHRDASSHVNS